MSVKKRYIITCISLVVVIVILLLTGEPELGRERVKKQRPPLIVDTLELDTFDFDIMKAYIGTLYPANRFELQSKVGGRVVEMNYDVGDTVQNGSVVARIDDTPYLLQLEQVQRKLNIEQSKVRQKEMSIEQAEREYERMLALRAEKVVSESSLEKAKYNLAQQRMTFDVDQASLKMQETAVELSKLQWSYTKINAQWAQAEDVGTRVLAERFVDVGAMITPNTKIATILDVGLLKAEIFVGEKQYPRFAVGMKVNIEVDAFPGVRFAGTVERLAPFINEQTRQAKVLIRVPNEDLRLRPGMFARTSVIFSTRTGVPMLPKSCVVEKKGKSGVFLYDSVSDTVSFVPVKIGWVRKGFAEILNADQIDRPVVSVGQHMLSNRQRVQHVDRQVMDKAAERQEKGEE